MKRLLLFVLLACVARAQVGTSIVRFTDGTNIITAGDNANNAVRVNCITGCAGAGGTSSSFGAAFPASGTAAGFSDGTNMQGARVFDLDTGAGTIYVLGANLRRSAAAAATELIGQQTMANSLPVTMASDQSNINVVVNAALPTGANTIGSIASITTSVTPGTAAANLGKAEDQASADGDVGVMLLARRTATPANTSGVDLDYEALQMANGRLWASATIDAALPTGTNAIGRVGHDVGTIGHGVKTITLAGTDEALAVSTAAKYVTIQAQTDNTGWIAIGAAGVDAAIATGTGVLLAPGATYTLKIGNLADVFVDSTVSGDGVRYTYQN